MPCQLEMPTKTRPRVGDPDLFRPAEPTAPRALGPAAWHLPGFALAEAADLLNAVAMVERQAPLRHMTTPGGRRIGVAMTNCGDQGWVSDRSGYRYQYIDPDSGQPWPAMPPILAELATRAAAAAGFDRFVPDAGLINRYQPGVGMGLHQDRDEHDLTAPIVSLSLGMTATFLFGGLRRGDRPQRIALQHGDAVVWGGADRLRFHGIAPLRGPAHPLLGAQRLNITLRKAR